jgi:hypothetical protein
MYVRQDFFLLAAAAVEAEVVPLTKCGRIDASGLPATLWLATTPPFPLVALAHRRNIISLSLYCLACTLALSLVMVVVSLFSLSRSSPDKCWIHSTREMIVQGGFTHAHGADHGTGVAARYDH